MAQILVAPSAEQDTVIAEQARLTNFARLGPARGAISRDALDLPCAPNGHGDRDDDGGDPAGGGDVGTLDEDVPRIGVVNEPPPEEGGRMIDWPTEEFEPWKAELGLEGQTPSDPLRCSPDEGERHGADEQHLAPEDLGRVHGGQRSGLRLARTASAKQSHLASAMLWRANGTLFLSRARPVWRRTAAPR